MPGWPARAEERFSRSNRTALKSRSKSSAARGVAAAPRRWDLWLKVNGARVNALVRRLGLKPPTQTLILLPPHGGYRVHEIRLCPVTKEMPRRLVVDVRPAAEQPADEVVIVPRAIPADVLVEFVTGEENKRLLATIGGDVSSGPPLPAEE